MLIWHNFSLVMHAGLKPKWRYRLLATFFGLSDRYIEAVYEQFFFLKYHGGWSFSEAYNLPVGLRTWFLERLLKQLEAETEAIKRSSKGSGMSAPRELTAFNQPPTPGGGKRG